MAFAEQVSFQEYPDSAAATFTITDFYFQEPEHIYVFLYPDDGSPVQEKDVGVDWSISGTTITRITSWDPGTVLVRRLNPYLQTSTYRNAEIRFDRELLEYNLDYITMLTQQNADIYRRSIHAPIYEDVNLELPIISERVSPKFMTFDAQGNLVCRFLQGADIGAISSGWDPTFIEYDNGDDWLVSYNDRLWLSVAPINGKAPSVDFPAEWTLLTKEFLVDNTWQMDVNYPVGSIVAYDLVSANIETNKALWIATAPVKDSPPGDVDAEWKPFAIIQGDNVRWVENVPYRAGTAVMHNQKLWLCLVDSKNVEPGSDPLKWIVYSNRFSDVKLADDTHFSQHPEFTLFIDTTTQSDITVNLSPGAYLDQRVTVSVYNGGRCFLLGDGLGTTIESGFATEVIWTGTVWTVFAGEGGTPASGGLAVGDILWWPSLTVPPPTGMIPCDGSIVDIIDYTALFDVIGTTWGGDGLSTFGIPSFEGLVYDDVTAGEIRADQNGTYVIQAVETFDPGTKIYTENIEDGAVTNPKLAADAVTGDKIADDAVDSEHIVAGAVGTPELATDAVTNDKMADNSVGTPELQDGSVTAAKLAADTFNYLFPVGFTYAQYPGGATPAAMGWPGTWTEQFQTEGIFFRTPGGTAGNEALAFGTGIQSFKDSDHIHMIMDWTGGGGTGAISADDYRNPGCFTFDNEAKLQVIGDASGGSDFWQNDSWSAFPEVPTTSVNKPWPENRTFRIWLRTA